MAINQELNILLKEMWRLDEKTAQGEQLNDEELKFFNENLTKITEYYKNNSQYWNNKTTLI